MSTDYNISRHRGGSGCVYVVMVYKAQELVTMAVLSSPETVQSWLDTHYKDNDFKVLTAPFIVDEPEWNHQVMN